MPETIDYDADKKRLLIGRGYVEHVEPRPCGTMKFPASRCSCNGSATGRQIESPGPIIGDRRLPSPLGDIQPDYWLAEYSDRAD